MKKEIIILFDFDGVIVDSFDVALTILRMSKPTLTRKRFQQSWNKNIVDIVYTDKVVRKINIEKEYAKKSKTLPLSKNIKAIIQNLSKEFQLFIVSSAISKIIEDYLRRHGILECFTEILGYDVEPNKVKKFKMIFNKYSTDPKNSIFITDTSGDIAEAKEARVGYIVGILGGYQTKKSILKANPDIIVKDFNDFFDVIKSRY